MDVDVGVSWTIHWGRTELWIIVIELCPMDSVFVGGAEWTCDGSLYPDEESISRLSCCCTFI